ncbi:hypothetical protein AB0P17_15520 [Streptomyces sp. NPDC088124]|uniref:hypothetical protein n=1 Tax=Streptomyces sp. NPDC088124 TaxID=3154654 RepID=UPI003431BE20
MAALTTAQRLIDFRRELEGSGEGFTQDLLADLVRDASHTIVVREGLLTRPELPPPAESEAPGGLEGVGESKSPA